MALGLNLRLSLAAGTSASAIAAFTSADQRLLTNGASNDITTSKPTAITADGVSIGSSSGTPATLSWTPSSIDNDVELLTADGDAQRHAVVAAANTSLYNISSYSTNGNVTITSGHPDPLGGSNAYKVIANTGGGAKAYRINASATGTPATANSGLEVWVKPIGTLLPIIRLYPLNWYAEVNPAAKTAAPSNSGGFDVNSISVVEESNGWYRIWARGERGSTLSSSFFIDFLNDFYTGTSVDVPSGEHGFYIFRPRYVDGSLPLYDQQLIHFAPASSTADYARLAYRGSLYADTAVQGYVHVLVPTTYDANRSTPYKICIVPPVEPTPGATLTNDLSEVKAGGYHDTYDCIFVSYSTTTNIYPWGGVRNTGDYNHSRMQAALPAALRRYGYNITSDREETYIAGYSKAGWNACSAILLHPETFGKAASWDAPWTEPYSGLAANLHFGNEATFLLYRPYDILAANKASVNDTTRLVISNGSAWTSQHAAMKTLMDGEGVTYTEVTGLTAVGHDADTAWMGPVFAAMFAL